MKIRLVRALGLLMFIPLLPAIAADADSLRPKVAKILERHGIVGNAALERRLSEAAGAPQVSGIAYESAQNAEGSEGPLPHPATAPAADVVGVILRFTAPELAERAAANLPPPDEVIDALADASFVPLQYKRPMSLGRHVFTFPTALDMETYRELEALLQKLAIVESIHPERTVDSQLVPDDPYFHHQWSLRKTGDYSPTAESVITGINAVEAWDLVLEDNAITVAVVDSGLTGTPPVETSRVLPGFDFISSPADARDGDGWDDDPTDEGNWHGANECSGESDASSSSWHGTKMASVIAARGDDNQGIAGIDWEARIVPVRVLGKCGGATSDIIDGMLWAAGFPVPGAPENAYPARVINMSLGSLRDTGCSPFYQEAINAARIFDVVIVASVGNEDSEAAFNQPSNCLGPVAVAAVDHLGERASYSNWTNQGAVDISAPGGDGTRHGNKGRLVALSDDGEEGPSGEQITDWTGGTSTAAAHVSGALALAMRLDPLQHTDLLVAIMLETAQPFGNGTECESEYLRCGVGILDLEAMIQGALVFKDYAVVRDFYHPELKHYFRSGNWDEVSLLVKGFFGEWQEFDDKFLAWRDGSTVGSHPVCRFYGTPGIGPNSHFYTVDPDECEFVKQNDPGWTYEGTAFYAKKKTSLGGCPRNTERLYRYYNQRAHLNDSNHRYTTSLADREEMEANGWVMEGIAMCVPD